MNAGQVLLGLHKISLFVLEVALVGDKLLRGLGQSALGVGHGLGICRALVLGILHELLVVILGIFLLKFHDLIFLLHIVDQCVDHLDDSRGLLTLFLVGEVGLWRRRRGSASLRETDAGAGNATR